MTTPEQARQLVRNLRMNDYHNAADCIESLLEQLAEKDQRIWRLMDTVLQMKVVNRESVSAYREAMNAGVGIDYKSPGNVR